MDLRSVNAFTKSHIPGAINFSAEEIYGQLAAIEQQIPKDAEIVLYGIDREDSAPTEVASLIEMLGYRNIKILAEGWAGWGDKVKEKSKKDLTAKNAKIRQDTPRKKLKTKPSGKKYDRK